MKQIINAAPIGIVGESTPVEGAETTPIEGANIKFTLSTSTFCGNKMNTSYPKQVEITSLEDLLDAARYDHVGAVFGDGKNTRGKLIKSYRIKRLFESSNVIIMDCDNTESDEPEQWMTPEDVRRAFPDVPFYVIYSRNHMKEKDGRSPRPKFHVYFPLSRTMTDENLYSEFKERVRQRFPAFDKRAVDSAHFLFGVVDPTGEAFEGTKTIDSLLLQIPKGQRNSTLSSAAAGILTRLGDNEDARKAFLKLAERCEEPLESHELASIWRSAQSFYHEKVEKRPDYILPAKFSAMLDFANDNAQKYVTLTKLFMEENQFVVGTQLLSSGGYGDDIVYIYEGGVWKPHSAMDMTSLLGKRVYEEGFIPDPAQVEKARKSILTLGERRLINAFNPDEDLVCFQNGVYRLSDGAVLPHDPKYYFTLQLNAKIPLKDDVNVTEPLDASAVKLEETPYCDKCLANFGSEDVQLLLLEIFGGAISNVSMYRFKKAVLHFGVGNSGKTQLKDMAQRILGEANYNNVDLGNLETNRFLAARFQNVRIAGSNDMSNVKIKEEKIFKQLTGGDTIEAEHKCKDGFTFKFKGILWFLANQLPLFGGDKGDHVYNRWITIPATNAIPEEERIADLSALMFEERNSFCIKALMAFRGAVERDYKFTEPEVCRLAREEYKIRNSSVRTFIDECCEPIGDNPSDDQTTGKMWDAFKHWCYIGQYYQPSKGEFKRELSQILNMPEEDLVIHRKKGDFYPMVVSNTALKEMEMDGIF